MKNTKKKICLISVVIVLLITTIFLLQAKKEKIEMTNPRTDIEILQKWFPNLEGIESAVWETEVAQYMPVVKKDGEQV